MNTALHIRPGGLNDLPLIEQLAQQIWPATYGSILSRDQIEYMLSLIYSLSSLQDQLLNQKHRFLIAELDHEPVGFADYSFIGPPGIFKLNKIYVHPDTQGKGVGKQLLEHVIQLIRPQKATALRLNVNRYNKAKTFYESMGFTVVYEEDIDIGCGYYMNDYVMEKTI